MTDREELVLVTGANGFIGSHLVEALLARRYRVRCMVRRSSDLSFIRDLPVEWVHADLGDPESLQQACQGVDRVCHCAALTRALTEESFMQVNAQGAEELALACIKENPDLRRFLLVSSMAAAGPAAGPAQYKEETSPCRPITWYGKSKLAAEEALTNLGARLPLTIVRPSVTFGPRDRDLFTYFELVKHGLSLQLGREKRWVSLIYAHDLVRLLLLALEKEEAVGQIYFGCNQAHTYTDLSEAIARALNKRTLHVVLPEAVLGPITLWSKVQTRLTGRPGLLNEQRVRDMREHYWLCSGDKARRELGFAAQTDLEMAVEESVEWYLENGWL